jgi:hypothetical protein
LKSTIVTVQSSLQSHLLPRCIKPGYPHDRKFCDRTNQLPIAAIAAAMGGNVRVGLEDSLWGAPGRLAASNAEQVVSVRKIIEGMGLEIATPEEAREILDLSGVDMVAF